MRRLPALSLVILISLSSLLAGCVGRNKGSEPWEQGKDLKPVTLTFCFPNTLHPDTKKVLNVLEKKAYRELKVDLVFEGFEPGNYIRKIREKITEGKPCDGFVVTREDVGPLIEPEMLRDVKGLFPRYAPDYFSSINKELLASITNDGKLLGVPSNTRLGYGWTNPMRYRVSLIVRDDLLNRTGIKEIKNLDDYKIFLTAVRKLESGIIPACFDFSTMDIFAAYYNYVVFSDQLGLVYKADDPKMRLIPWEQTPEFKSSLNLILEWKNTGYLNYKYPEEDDFKSGKYASFLVGWQGPDTEKYYNRYASSPPKGWRYKSFDLCDGKKSYVTFSEVPFMAFNNNSLNVDRAIMFLEWLQSDVENYKLLMYGIEGVHYTWNKKEGYKSLQEPETAYPGPMGYVFSNYRQLPWNPDGLKKDDAEYEKKIGKYIEYSPHTGFYVNGEEFFERYRKENALRNYYKLELFLSNEFMEPEERSIQPEDIDPFINSQRTVADKITTELQPQLNSWIDKYRNK